MSIGNFEEHSRSNRQNCFKKEEEDFFSWVLLCLLRGKPVGRGIIEEAEEGIILLQTSDWLRPTATLFKPEKMAQIPIPWENEVFFHRL